MSILSIKHFTLLSLSLLLLISANVFAEPSVKNTNHPDRYVRSVQQRAEREAQVSRRESHPSHRTPPSTRAPERRPDRNTAEHRPDRRAPERHPHRNAAEHRFERERDAYRPDRHHAYRPAPVPARYFTEHHRRVIREYYRHGARRHPPRWHRGRLLPRGVVYRPVPTYLYHRIGPPPVGCRYIDIDGDILLVALTTGLIMDILYNE